jgi:hypothetical protein
LLFSLHVSLSARTPPSPSSVHYFRLHPISCPHFTHAPTFIYALCVHLRLLFYAPTSHPCPPSHCPDTAFTTLLLNRFFVPPFHLDPLSTFADYQ